MQASNVQQWLSLFTINLFVALKISPTTLLILVVSSGVLMLLINDTVDLMLSYKIIQCSLRCHCGEGDMW